MNTPLTWRDRSAQWARFSEWEEERSRNHPPDFARALSWASAAWALAQRCDPDWASEARVLEHVEHIVRVRAGLARLPLAR